MNRGNGTLLAIAALSAIAIASTLGVTAATKPPAEALVEMEVKDVVPLDDESAHAVILVSKEGTVLPVFVDEAAAVAIAFRLAHRPPPHAMVEDLLARVVDEMGGKVTRVRIGAVQNHLDLCTIDIRHGGKTLQLAARPSDSIALALTSGAKIFAKAALVEQVGITRKEIEDLKSRLGVGGSGKPEDPPPPPPGGSEFSL
ncbi:MAG: bifunctional nuclease family protein [Myxococcales bacterium]|nr:bifunctional nuclease family protein [Myxococcales bacterium]